MKDNRCPNCDLLNLPSSQTCLKCGTSLSNEPRKTDFKIAAETQDYTNPPAPPASFNTYETATPPTPFGFQPVTNSHDNKTGRRTHFWYRIFCSLIVIPNIIWVLFGIIAIFGSYGETGQKASDTFFGGIMFLVVGAFFAFIYILGVILPTKPFHWIYGILLIVLGIISCVLAPIAAPLLYFWVKPETQAFFERK